MCSWKLISKKVLGVKVPIETVNAIMADIDVNGDGCVSVMEIIAGLKKIL